MKPCGVFGENWNTFWTAIGALATFALGVVALVLPWWLERRRRPKLNLAFRTADIEVQPEGGNPESKWVRIRVENAKGRRVARGCRAYLIETRCKAGLGGNWKLDEHLHVRQLTWTHNWKEEDWHLPRDLIPGIPQFIDLLNTQIGTQKLFLQTIPRKQLPENMTYLFTVQVSAEDADPEIIRLLVRCSDWDKVEVSIHSEPVA